NGEAALEMHVVQPIPAKSMDETVEALALAGATAIWPVLTTRGVARPYPRRVTARLERWRVIAREAAQLAGRARPPTLHPTLPLDAALRALPDGCLILACVIDAPGATTGVRFVAGRPVAVVIGPEGGLDESSDIRVVNSCTVTAQADATTRQRLHRLRRADPSSHIVLTGCSVDGNPDRYLPQRHEPGAQLPDGVDAVFANHDKNAIAGYVTSLLR